MITKRARIQFHNLIAAANVSALCVVKCHNIKTGEDEHVVCSHRVVNGVVQYEPLAKLFRGNPYAEITPPGESRVQLI